MSEFIVAIDGGGSKTEFLLADLEGKIVKKHTGAPTCLSSAGLGQAAYNLREGWRLLLEGETDPIIKQVVLALAGMDTYKDYEGASRVFGEMLSEWSIERLTLVNDAMAALVGGTSERPAVVLIGGTGANCFGWDEQGRSRRVSGLDYLLADEGSGYDAGRLAIKAAVRSFDGRGQKTILQEKVFQHFDVTTAGALKDEVYSPPIAKDEVAAFGKIVIEAAHDGDEVAAGIVNYCLGQLLLDVKAVAAKLDFADKPFKLILAGNFLLALESEFRDLIALRLPSAEILIPEKSPVHGALAIAQEILGGKAAAEFQLWA